METKESCLHSKLPVVMKETFVFDFKDTLLVCSSETKSDQKNLQCFMWDVSDKKWTVFETPLDNGVYGFISAVQIPGKQVPITNTKVINVGSNTFGNPIFQKGLQNQPFSRIISVLG